MSITVMSGERGGYWTGPSIATNRSPKTFKRNPRTILLRKENGFKYHIFTGMHTILTDGYEQVLHPLENRYFRSPLVAPTFQ